MDPDRILVVEDDADINLLLKHLLEGAGYAVTSAFSGSEARLVLAQEPFDLILLDLMLPGMDGEQLISAVRGDRATPIIVISAKPGTAARVTALRLGADDFVPKPFDSEEILARVGAQLRRSRLAAGRTPDGETVYRHKNCVIDPAGMTVRVKGTLIELTAREFQLLLLFFRHPGQVFTRSALFDRCWGQGYVATDNTVDVHISRIRGKLAAADPEEYIHTIRGIGYRLSS